MRNTCPKGLVEDLNEMKVIKAGIEKTKNAFPDMRDEVTHVGVLLQRIRLRLKIGPESASEFSRC